MDFTDVAIRGGRIAEPYIFLGFPRRHVLFPLFFYFLFPHIQTLKAYKNGALFLLVIRFILIIIARVTEGVAKRHKEL